MEQQVEFVATEQQVGFVEATLEKLGDEDSITEAIDGIALSIVATKISFVEDLGDDEKVKKYIEELNEALAAGYYEFNLLEMQLDESTHERIRIVRGEIIKALGVLEVKGENISHKEVDKLKELDEEVLEALKGMFKFPTQVPEDPPKKLETKDEKNETPPDGKDSTD